MTYPQFEENLQPWGDNDSGKKPSLEEQRMFSRFRVDFPSRLRNLNMGRRSEGKCFDIGAGGAGFETQEEYSLKTPVDIWIEVNDGFEPINLKGRVIWSKQVSDQDYRTGVVFDCPRLIAFSRVLKTLRK